MVAMKFAQTKWDSSFCLADSGVGKVGAKTLFFTAAAACEPRKKRNGLTFDYTGCLIGILIMVYNSPHITG